MNFSQFTTGYAEFAFDDQSHHIHFRNGHRVRPLQGGGVTYENEKATIPKFGMNLIVVNIRQVVNLLITFHENVIQTNTADEAVRSAICGDDGTPEFIVWNYAKFSSACIENWERAIHDRNYDVKRFALWNIHKQGAILLGETLRHNNHFVEQISEEMFYLIVLGLSCLCCCLVPLPPRDTNRDGKCDQCAYRLHPRCCSGVMFDPVEKCERAMHKFHFKMEILA